MASYLVLLTCEQSSSSVLVNHSSHSIQQSSVLISRHRNAASSGANHNRLILEQRSNCVHFHNALWSRRGDDAAPLVAQSNHCSQSVASVVAVQRPDRLGRSRKGRVFRNAFCQMTRHSNFASLLTVWINFDLS